MDLPTNLLIFFIPLFLITGQILSQSEPKPVLEYCADDAGNYTAESTYKTNIDYLLSNLTSLASSSLFNDHSVGGGTADQTYGLYMCRGDFTSQECDTCIKAASTAIVEKCPVYKEAIMWYENCMIRYANRDINSLEEVWPVAYQWSSSFNASDPSQFGQLLAETVNGLIPQRAYNSSNKGYAAGQIKMSLFEDLYVLIQCTPDVLGEPCEKCLRVALRNVGTCCGTISLMMSMYLPSCWLHHSNTPLVRELDDTPSVSPASPVLPPAPAPPSPLSNETNSSNSIPPEGSSAATITEGGNCFVFGLVLALSTTFVMIQAL